MKIGIDCRLWNESGVGRYIRNLVENLQVLDQKNEYVLFVQKKDFENRRWKIVNANFRWHTIEEQLLFPSILNKEHLDLVHFPYISVPIFYNKPFVVTIHDLILLHFPTGEASTLPLPLYRFKLLGYKFIIRRAAQKAAKIITVSNATKEEIIDHLGIKEDKISVIYEGVDFTMQKSKVKNQNSKLQFKSKKYFLYVGNAYPHKNLDGLVEAFSTVCHPELDGLPSGTRLVSGSQLDRDSSQASPDQNDMKLVLVGREDYFYKRLKEKVRRMGLKDLVMFYGEATDEELQRLYRNALALIMPSLMEGFGLPAVEAMVNKCLVLASDIPSLREICGNTTLYFNPLNVKGLVDKMRTVTLHTTVYGALEDLRRRAYERAKMFSWKKMARETLKIYEETISNPKV